MGLYKQAMNFILKGIWPWIVKHVWPSIKEHVVELIMILLKKLVEKIKDYFNKRSKEQEREAEEKAEQAEEKAKAATDKSEAHEYRAIAQVWREVAEKHRIERDEYKAKLESLLQEQMEEASATVHSLPLSIASVGDIVKLDIGGHTHRLPPPQV